MSEYQFFLQQYEQERKQERENAVESVKPVLNKLLNLGVTEIRVNYSGAGDSGCIDNLIILTDETNNESIVLEAADEDLIEEFTYTYLPDGWEINDGSEGTMRLEFDCQLNHVTLNFDHYWLQPTYDENSPHTTIELGE